MHWDGEGSFQGTCGLHGAPSQGKCDSDWEGGQDWTLEHGVVYPSCEPLPLGDLWHQDGDDDLFSLRQVMDTLEGHTRGVLCLCYSLGDGTLLASGGGDRVVHIWKAPEGGKATLVHRLRGHTDEVGHPCHPPPTITRKMEESAAQDAVI